MAPSPLQQAVINFVFRFILRAQRTGSFTKREADLPTVIFEVTLSESREDLYLYDDDDDDDDDDEIIAQTFQDDEMVYADVAASILLDDWVGPVTAAFEVWKNGGHGQPRLRHGPTSIEPAEDNPTNPVISSRI
ncbi:uncharacterized protein ACHE_80312A [Aspergillus chevalieri]|uniref:Uncharacterized protein n=1 Tax=Aspergillus chevalieri TaxID=182096 RepID=A0A7R7VX61_ASPCH|nr:uncharacterized protein ACHE_80312A [Aspergillus chevalieri]BCR92412.1 hypothetical protein ACHE_80312A [Aspergillus chevalieri]